MGLQLAYVLAGYAWEPHHVAEGSLAASALAAHEGGDPLHYVALGLREEEEGGVPVAVGVYPARRRVEALGLHHLLGGSLHRPQSGYLVALHADGALVWGLT